MEVEFKKVEGQSGLGIAENYRRSLWHALPPHVFNI